MASILAAAPHPDDEVLGCGGSTALHTYRTPRRRWVYGTEPMVDAGAVHLPGYRCATFAFTAAMRAAKSGVSMDASCAPISASTAVA